MTNYTLDLTGDQVNAALKEVHNNIVVKKTAQTFTDAEKNQIRENIGAGSGADVAAISEKIGNQTLPTIEQTLTGAITELNSDIEELSEKTVNGYAIKANVELRANDIPFENSQNPETGSLEEKIQNIDAELATKANQDGFYYSMAVGNAEQLISSVGVTDKVPYNFRTSGGSADIGNRLNDKIVGGTICWNQLAQHNEESKTENGITFTNNGDGSWKVNGTATADAFSPPFYTLAASRPAHKYYLTGCPSGGSASTYYVGGRYVWTGESTKIDTGNGNIVFDDSDVSNSDTLVIVIREGTTVNNRVFRPQLFDLTAMFGSAIADYVYSLEQSTTGAGGAWFKKLFPKRFYKYNAGELMSVCTNEHITTGFNQLKTAPIRITVRILPLDKNTAVKVVPNVEYYFGFSEIPGASKYRLTLSIYELDGSVAGRDIIKRSYPGFYKTTYGTFNYYADAPTSQKCKMIFNRECYAMMAFSSGDTSASSVMRDPVFNISWSGYRNGEYEPYVEHRYPLSPVELRGIPKLDASNNLYFDGDTYEKDGTVTRRYQYRDYQEGDSSLPDTITDGIHTVTTLTTPTTETANPFSDPQIIDDFGTEEYVDALATAETNPRDVEVPVGHETFYQANLRDKLQNLPANAGADGLYLVKQTGNKQELIAYTPESELPTIQTEGTYVLKSVNGVLTWVLGEDVYNQIMDVINDHRMLITVVQDSTGAFTANATNTRYVCTAADATEITFDPPAEASEGDQIIVEFHSGATPTTLTLVSTNARYNFKTVPANAYFEINAMYTAGKWSVFGSFIVD